MHYFGEKYLEVTCIHMYFFILKYIFHSHMYILNIQHEDISCSCIFAYVSECVYMYFIQLKSKCESPKI